MLTIQSWDEIGCEWGIHELDLPPTCTDAAEINKALGQLVADTDDEDGDGWTIEDHKALGMCRTDSTLPSILTIVARSDRNHQAIIVVNYEDQEG